jgi:uncharacterized protein
MSPVDGSAGWREAVVAFIRREALPVDKFGHQPRLYRLCSEIASAPETAAELKLPPEQSCDDDVLFAAVWMHDLGVFTGHRPSDPVALAAWDHVPYTIARSRELLTDFGFPQEKLDAVAECMRTHEAKCEPVLPEAVVLRDADMLEQLGAVGALRALVKIGRDTRYARFSDVIPVLERAAANLPGKLRLTRSRELADGRVKALEQLLAAIRDEAGDLLL